MASDQFRAALVDMAFAKTGANEIAPEFQLSGFVNSDNSSKTP